MQTEARADELDGLAENPAANDDGEEPDDDEEEQANTETPKGLYCQSSRAMTLIKHFGSGYRNVTPLPLYGKQLRNENTKPHS